MPVQEKRRETTAGLFVLIGFLLLGGLIVQFGRLGGSFTDKYPLFVEFPETAGIINNSEVRLRGAKVGRVASKPELIIDGNTSYVKMKLLIRDDVKIPQDSLFQIGSSGLLGDKYIDITPPKTASSEFHTAGATITGDSSGNFDAIKSDAENIARDTSKLIKDAQITMTKVNDALDSIKSSSDSLNLTINTVNQQFLSEKNKGSFSLMLKNFEVSSLKIKEASEQLQPTITEARETITDFRITLASIEKSANAALEPIPNAVKSIDRAASKAEQTISSFQSEDSVAGALTSDEETGTNAKEFIKNLKRYGILGYRDDSSPEDYDPRNKFRGSRR
ncbi:MAG: MlaD family protein [Akkermansiaceae bacterium]